MSNVRDMTAADFNAEVLNADVPVVVDFWAPWCGPCRMVGPEVDKLATQFGDKVRFFKVNVDENQELAMRYEVMSIPTILKFERGDVSGRVVGAMGAGALAKEFGLEA